MKKIIIMTVRIVLGAAEMALTLAVMYLLVILAEHYTPNVVWVRLMVLVPIVIITAVFELKLIKTVQRFVPYMR